MANVPGGSGDTTIGQVFQQKGLWPWFSSRVTKYFDGQSEKGQDYSTTLGTSVGVPVGGKIVRLVHNDNAINDQVELQDSSGAVWLYQHINAKVKVGASLGCGGVIGTENGLPVDQYSTGPHIEVRYCPPGKWNPAIDNWDEPWVNPKDIFAGLSSQIAGATQSGGIPGGYGPSLQQVGQALSSNADVAATLYALDQALELKNPFDTSNDNVDQITVLGVSIDNPFSWIGDVTQNMINDLAAIIVRTGCLVIGILLIYVTIQTMMIKQTSGALDAVGGVEGVAKLAALL